MTPKFIKVDSPRQINVLIWEKMDFASAIRKAIEQRVGVVRLECAQELYEWMWDHDGAEELPEFMMLDAHMEEPTLAELKDDLSTPTEDPRTRYGCIFDFYDLLEGYDLSTHHALTGDTFFVTGEHHCDAIMTSTHPGRVELVIKPRSPPDDIELGDPWFERLRGQTCFYCRKRVKRPGDTILVFHEDDPDKVIIVNIISARYFHTRHNAAASAFGDAMIPTDLTGEVYMLELQAA